MKKFSIFSFLFLTSFFFSFSNANASTYNITINPNDYIALEQEGFNTLRSDFISSNNPYFIAYQPTNGSSSYFSISTSLSSIPCYRSYPYYWCLSSNTFRFSSYDSQVSPPFSDLSTYSRGSYTSRKFGGYYAYENRLSTVDTNVELIPDANTYVISDGTYTYTCDGSTGECTLPTLYSFHEMFYSSPPPEPEPEDNTPILTSFYTIVGEKVGDLAVSMSDNYIYIAIIGVFILIFLIELLRRYFL